MIADYEKYHGVVIRELIVSSDHPLRIAPFVREGRIDTYKINDAVGLVVKHSAKRLPPWQFTYGRETLDEIASLRDEADALWFALVCGGDGILTLCDTEFEDLTSAPAPSPGFIRVDRGRHTQYRVFGNGGRLVAAKPRGVALLLEDQCLRMGHA